MKRFVCGSFLLILFIAGAVAQSDLQPLVNVRITKTEPITLKQLKDRSEIYQRQMGAAFTIAQKREVLDAIINEKLVVQAATKAGVTVADSEVNQTFLQYIAQQIGRQVTEVELAALVKEQTGLTLDAFMRSQVGMSVAEYKTYLKNQLVAQRYVASLKQQDLMKATSTDAEIRAYYEMNRSAFAQNDIVKLFLVVVPKGSDAAAAKTRANDMLRQVTANASAVNELKVRAQGANAGFQAGDMFINKSTQAAQQMGMDYANLLALFGQSAGFVSEMNETATDFQFYVIQEKHPAKLLELSDLVQPGTTVTVYEYVKSSLTQQKQSQILNESLNAVVQDLRKPENYQMMKTDAELNTLLNW
ncbi:MAG: peptidyl-prolyl cis-trans isomerase [Spirochaetaceae bacterium]|jgi:hypothetical protein|nr:peptidyl-prolyl cis-trans isomerase [Spirochaetaceae bacterium]